MVFYYFIIFIIFIFGLIVGSFLNCVIYRLETKQSFLKGRSFCPNCKHILNWKDLIPVFSFIILKGRCRYCWQKISWQYPIVELATGFLFVYNFWRLGFGFDLIFRFRYLDIFNICYMLSITCFLIIIFVYDLKHYIIPDKVIFPAIGIAFIYQLFRILNFEFISNLGFRISDFKMLADPFFSAVLASAFFLAIVLISEGRWMGLGDVKLAFFMGWFLGFPKILIALFFSFFIGAIIGLGLITFSRKTLKSEVPFGPFLVTGTFIALFWGEKIISWYFSLI